jgi:hypothetical protein
MFRWHGGAVVVLLKVGSRSSTLPSFLAGVKEKKRAKKMGNHPWSKEEPLDGALPLKRGASGVWEVSGRPDRWNGCVPFRCIAYLPNLGLKRWWWWLLLLLVGLLLEIRV